MRELVVLSGKGGTGKTSLVAALADLAPDKVLADCDVDASDLHLVLQPQIKRREQFVSGHLAVIDPEICLGCGECVEACLYGAIALEDGAEPKARITEHACEGCGVCVRVCPSEAIAFPPRRCGELYLSETHAGPLVHARLDVAAENSGKLVTRVRSEARRLATERDLPLLIVDGPPGTGCPVIASLGGADFVLAVTEPSVAGHHDLRRLLELAAHFSMPVAVCINKSDLVPDFTRRLRRWCDQEGVPVAGEVPYDPAVTAAQVAGISVVARGPGFAADALAEVWAGLEHLLADLPVRR